jgi:hypothetical protein
MYLVHSNCQLERKERKTKLSNEPLYNLTDPLAVRKQITTNLTVSLLMSYICGAPSKARNLTSRIYIYIYGRYFYWGFCLLNRAFR